MKQENKITSFAVGFNRTRFPEKENEMHSITVSMLHFQKLTETHWVIFQ